MRTVVGLFDNLTEAQRAFQELVQLGFGAENISVITNPGAQRAFESGARLNLSALDLTDVGRVAAVGPMRDVLSSSTDHASLSDTLRRYGLANDIADRYAAGVREGEILESILVNDNDSDRVVEVMRRHSHLPRPPARAAAPPITKPMFETKPMPDTRPMPDTSMPDTRPDVSRAAARDEGKGAKHRFTEEDRTIPVIREELRVGKREFEKGTVRAKVHVVERPVSSQVNLREEYVEIERRAVDRPLRGEERSFGDEQIEMQEYAEQPYATKEARVVEEIVLHKVIREHVEQIDDRVRNTEVDFERPFDSAPFKKHFAGLGLEGARYEEYAPAYRLGHELRTDRRIRGSRWEDIEDRVRASWESKSPGTWEKFKDMIRHAWSR